MPLQRLLKEGTTMDSERKNTENDKDAKNIESTGASETADEHLTDEMTEQHDSTDLKAVREAARLGGGDNFLVKTDLEDSDEREDVDQPDGRPSPMANADNQER